MFSFLKSRFNFKRDLAIDLGTANTLIYAQNQGIILNQPSIVAIMKERHFEVPYLFGESAKLMIGKTPTNISVHKPLQDGVIADFRIAEEMIRHFIKVVLKARGSYRFYRPNVVVCVPYESTDVERRAIQTAVEKCGAKEVFLIEEPMAAAIGAGLPVSEPRASMIVDIGGGTSEIAIISLGGVVHGRSVKIGGDAIDNAIIQFIRQKYNLLIGQSTAENIKKEIGTVYPRHNRNITAKVRGRDLVMGTPKEIEITQDDMSDALSDPVSSVISAVKIALETSPPELASDIVDRGIVLTGGGAMLKNLDYALTRATNLPIFIAPRPLYCVALGAGRVISDYKKYWHILFKQT